MELEILLRGLGRRGIGQLKVGFFFNLKGNFEIKIYFKLSARTYIETI